MLVTSIFSFSNNVFYPSHFKFHLLVTLILLSANAFNLDQSKILSFGKEFICRLQTSQSHAFLLDVWC